jgi:lycopene cyclase domain-containing protein
MSTLYLIGLLIGLTGMAIIDYRYKLAFWYNRRRTIFTVLIAVSVFVVWDIIGIALGIFRHGGSEYSLPFTIAPEFPIEELFFLTLLCYCTLVIYRGVEQWRSRI